MTEEIKSKDQIYYLPLEEGKPSAAFAELLEKYSHIPKDEVDDHLRAICDDAWEHHPYQCVGTWNFIDLGLSGDDLQKLKNGGKFLDVGCMFAQDTRKLVFDGAPPESVYGTGLRGEYFTLGYKLFRDQKILPKNHFIAADMLDTEASGLTDLKGKLDVINAVHFFHIFDLEDQRRLIKRFILLLKPEKCVMATGRMGAHQEARFHAGAHTKATTKSGSEMWEHDVKSFADLWKQAGSELDTEWGVKAWFWRFGVHSGEGRQNWIREENVLLTFVATRLNSYRMCFYREMFSRILE